MSLGEASDWYLHEVLRLDPADLKPGTLNIPSIVKTVTNHVVDESLPARAQARDRVRSILSQKFIGAELDSAMAAVADYGSAADRELAACSAELPSSRSALDAG